MYVAGLCGILYAISMQLSANSIQPQPDMLAELFSSKARAEFFRILFGLSPEEFHLREIQRQSGLAIRTVQREADNLAGLDLLIRRLDGNRTYYRANVSHPLYKTIREMVLKTSLLVEVLKKAFANEKADFVFMFGSAVNGKLKPGSDIDLFVIGKSGFRAVCNLLLEPVKVVGREINPHVMTLSEFNQRRKERDHFVTSVLESPVQMIVGEENELRKLG